MPSLSYCRFQNTLTELRACRNALRDEGLPDDEEEKAAALKLIKVARELVEIADETPGVL